RFERRAALLGELRGECPGRADRAGDEGGVPGRLARQPDAGAVDVAQPVLRSIAPEELAVRPERVRFDDLRPRRHVVPVDLQDQLRPGEVRLVERTADEVAALVEL